MKYKIGDKVRVKRNLSLEVQLKFIGDTTTAAIIYNGRAVKVAESHKHPDDTYGRLEGARVALSRLFEKEN